MIDKVALYGGAFDPVHRTHVQIASMVQNRFNLPVWIVPTNKHPWNKQTTDLQHRIKMCCMAFEGYTVSNLEEYNKSGTTWEMLEIARFSFPYTQFSLIVGEDAAEEVPNWSNGHRLISEYKFIVTARNGFPPGKDKWYHKTPHVYLPGKLSDISSTSVRKALTSRLPLAGHLLLPPGVFEYIQKNNLYGIQNPETIAPCSEA